MKKVLEFQFEIAEIGGERRRLVNARDLHKQLGIRTRFSDWIKRSLINQNFLQDVDFIVVLKNEYDASKFGGIRKQEEYLCTVETAKHLAMMAKTPKGKEVRNYFIEIERKYREYMIEQRRLARKMLNMESSTDMVCITVSAKKIAKVLGITMSVFDLNGFLRTDGYKHKHWYNATLAGQEVWNDWVMKSKYGGHRFTSQNSINIVQCLLYEKGISKLEDDIWQELVWIVFMKNWVDYLANR
nr:MAG TPA: AntA/AntB antirepressor [Caudoviricetes sp.]